MTEDEAMARFDDVPRETQAQLAVYVRTLLAENEHQNLISAATVPQIWARHILDSAQLLDLAPDGEWVDLGSGPGLPGLVVSIVGQRPVTLVENRARRIAFLRDVVAKLGIEDRVDIIGQPLERVLPRPYSVISARAFAPLDKLLTLALPFSIPDTRWILPKGRNAAAELAAVRNSWQGDFRIVPSVTDPDSAIIVASHVARKERR